MAAVADPVSSIQQQGDGGRPDAMDPNASAPQQQTGDEQAQAVQLTDDLKAALIEIRRTFKSRWQPKRMRFVQEAQRAFNAFRGDTTAILNDRSGALDSISQIMEGLLRPGDDPALYDHNENIYQMFCLSFIAALMVDLGKTRYQPADAQDEEDLEIARKASTIQGYIERLNDSAALQQIELLFLWLTGSYWCYTRYMIDEKAGFTQLPQIEMRKVKPFPDSFICPNCGAVLPDKSISAFSPMCPKCGQDLQDKDWFEGPELDLPVKVGEIESANGMVAWDIVNGLMVDANPEAGEVKDTELLDYSMECSAAKLRAAYPNEYNAINPTQGSDASSDGDASRMARSNTSTPGRNAKAVTTEGNVTYSRCWITPDAFNELEDQTQAQALQKLFPKGCKLVMCGDETFLAAVPEKLTDHWTWCGTIRGFGLYPAAAGQVCLDVQERVTACVNREAAYMDRSSFGTILYDADIIDGAAMAKRAWTPGNMTPVMRQDEETGTNVRLADLMFQPQFHIDAELLKHIDRLTMRAQLLCGVLPQIFGGSDPHVETASGQRQALNTALGRLKQFINQMRAEKAQRSQVSVKCAIENMDEEIRIVEEGDAENTFQTIQMLKAELSGNFFSYPETDEGFPASFEEIQSRIMELLKDNQKSPFVEEMLSDPDNAAVVARYLLPDSIKLPEDAQRAKIKRILHRLSKMPPQYTMRPDPQTGQPIKVPVPSISPEPNVDDPGTCQVLARKWLLENWEQQESNHDGYMNVMAFLLVSAQMAQEQAAKQALIQQAAAQQQGGGKPQQQAA
jgi:hypothetical protein